MELFYYTTTETMRYILTQGDIYATNIRYMNDSEEYVNGLLEIYKLTQNRDLLEEWIGTRKHDITLLDKINSVFSKENLEANKRNMEYYSISFCKKNDLLSQWAIYAKEAGVSIKMDFAGDKYLFSTSSSTEKCDNDVKAEWEIMPQEVYYFTGSSMDDEQLYKNTAFKVLDQLYPENLKDKTEGKPEHWRYVSTLVKRYDFYQEEECRLVFERNKSPYTPLIQYRQDKKVLKPYLDIYCDNGWPIQEVMIGPGFNQQVVFDSVAHFLDNSKIKIDIKNSRDYAERLKQYWMPYDVSLNINPVYQAIKTQWQDENWLDTIDMVDASSFFIEKMDILREDIHRGNSEELKNYIDNYYFTKNGVVLTKSSIPYIF